ncbi:MAG: type II toxin-antitoxin system Phd/YefM family antitoxin [Kiritimatiellia bacterium]
MKKVNMHEAKTHLSKIVKEVELGESYVIGKSGNPVAMLVPYTGKRKVRKPGAFKGQICLIENMNHADQEIAKLFERSEIEPS